MNKRDSYKKAIDLLDKIKSENPFWVNDERYYIEMTKGILKDKLENEWMKND